MSTIRRVRAEEWEQARMLRLAALADPAAPIAFLDGLEEALSLPAEFWEERTAAAAIGPHAQFVAEADSREWLGTLTVLVFEARDVDYVGQPSAAFRASVVGVYVRPEHRGLGVVDSLLAAAKDFAAGMGLAELHLEVHPQNARARGAYERAGFVAVVREGVGAGVGGDILMVARVN